MGGPKAFQKVAGGDERFSKLQANLEQVLTPLIRNQLLDSLILKDLSLVSGSNRIEHKLGRALIGYVPIRQSNAATIYDTAIDDKFLYLTASANITVSLLVF